MSQGKDYLIDENGNLVFTQDFLAARGDCCESGCKNCPYGFHDRKLDPSIPSELQKNVDPDLLKYEDYLNDD